MTKDKKNVVIGYNSIVKDLLDNYDKYTNTEKQAVKNVLIDMYNLNRTLDKYDIKTSTWKNKVKEAFDKFFD